MSWLDSLARRAAGAPTAATAFADGDVAPAAEGTTRRNALRTAAGATGAAALLGPLRLLLPAGAAAATTQRAECSSASFEKVYADFQACVKNPLADFEDANELIPEKEEFLRAQKKPAARRRLKRMIKELSARRERAVKDLEFCSAAFGQDRAEGEAKCQATFPPAGGGTSGGGTGSGDGCEAGFVLCADHCCNLSNAYCQGCNSKVICCRLEADCCPSG